MSGFKASYGGLADTADGVELVVKDGDDAALLGEGRERDGHRVYLGENHSLDGRPEPVIGDGAECVRVIEPRCQKIRIENASLRTQKRNARKHAEFIRQTVHRRDPHSGTVFDVQDIAIAWITSFEDLCVILR